MELLMLLTKKQTNEQQAESIELNEDFNELIEKITTCMEKLIKSGKMELLTDASFSASLERICGKLVEKIFLSNSLSSSSTSNSSLKLSSNSAQTSSRKDLQNKKLDFLSNFWLFLFYSFSILRSSRFGLFLLLFPFFLSFPSLSSLPLPISPFPSLSFLRLHFVGFLVCLYCPFPLSCSSIPGPCS